MSDSTRLKYLRIALVLVGIIFIFGIYSLMIAWLGWTWHTGQSDYPLMIVGIYATLGVFLIPAARDPLAHLSLIWFTVWSSVVHSGIMAVRSGAGRFWPRQKLRHYVPDERRDLRSMPLHPH